MLLPSAIPCESSRPPPMTRLQSALFVSPPASPPQLSAQTAIGNIFTTCRSLQALLATPSSLSSPPDAPLITPPSTSHGQQLAPQQCQQPLLTPPLAHAPPPLKLRLRSRRAPDTESGTNGADHPVIGRKKIRKRVPAPLRGVNKRRRAADDDLESDLELGESSNPAAAGAQEEPSEPLELEQSSPPHTPKRSRIAPPLLPPGLGRGDFHSLIPDGPAADEYNAAGAPGTDVVEELDGASWSKEDDRMLIELVLQKLQLSEADWLECARSMRKNACNVNRRWQSLTLGENIGLKHNADRRPRVYNTFR